VTASGTCVVVALFLLSSSGPVVAREAAVVYEYE
jgi:hypothetical protein